MKQYINLHNHTTGSLLDGASKFDVYAERAKELGQPAVVTTDHGNVRGLIDAYEAAQACGLKYLPGQEFYQARKTRFDMDEDERAGQARNEWDQRGPHHLGIIAYNNEGYHNLLKLSSEAYMSGLFVKPRIDFELLEQYSSGLVILSGCLSGMISEAILREDYDYALQTAARFQDIVGKENFFIELHNHGIEEQAKTWEPLKKIARSIDAPIVVTCDSHYTFKEDADLHDILLCINVKKVKSDENRFKFSNDQFYLKSYDEMVSLFGEEEYVKNTMLVYDKCDFVLPSGEQHFPKYPIQVQGLTSDDLFDQKVADGAQMRFGENWRNDSALIERIEYESKVIKEAGFTEYFLILHDIIVWAKDQGVLMGPGRGSAASSVVAYCLRITEVDPLKYDLLFERFLTPGQTAWPDVDVDCPQYFRPILINHVREKYGYENTSQIGTMGTIKAKKAIRDVCRVLEKPYELGSELSAAMPPPLFGVPPTLEMCMETEAFRNLYDTNKDARVVIDMALKLEGLWRDPSMHAAGLVIADAPITNYVPTYKSIVKNQEFVATQWEMGRIEQMGLLKMDFLGLRNLDIIEKCIKLLKETKGINIDDPWKLVDDPEAEKVVFKALSEGNTVTSFQLESKGITELAIAMKPDRFDDIVALLALFRPGPMGSNVHKEYVERKHGRAPLKTMHPALEPILGRTYQLLLYQEQVLRIAMDIAGFSVQDASTWRKAMGKKDHTKMVKMKDQFITGCQQVSGFTLDQATQLYEEISHHADYSFNISHAAAYGFISFVTTYLHAQYPLEYMTAALSSVADSQDRLRKYLAECGRLGIRVNTPDVQISKDDFSVVGDEIYYGLMAIKGMNESAVKPIEQMQKEVELSNIFDFLREADDDLLNKKTIEQLMFSGGFDSLLNQTELPVESPLSKDYIDTLLKEYHLLNLFVSDHPYRLMETEIEKYPDHVFLKECYDLPNKTHVLTSGIIVDISKITTRRGTFRYELILEDKETAIRATIFPNKSAEIKDGTFNKGDFIVVKGKVDRFEDEENPITDLQIYNFQITPIASENNIFLDATQMHVDDLKIRQILDIIDKNKGNSIVMLRFTDTVNNNKTTITFKTKANQNIEPHLLSILEQ